MGYQLRRWLRDELPAECSLAERAIALEIADDARDETRTSTHTPLDVLARRAGLDVRTAKEMLRRLALRGWELRRQIGKGSDGRPLYAVSGVKTVYEIPTERTAPRAPLPCRGGRKVRTAGPTPVGPAPVGSGVAGPTPVGPQDQPPLVLNVAEDQPPLVRDQPPLVPSPQYPSKNTPQRTPQLPAPPAEGESFEEELSNEAPPVTTPASVQDPEEAPKAEAVPRSVRTPVPVDDPWLNVDSAELDRRRAEEAAVLAEFVDRYGAVMAEEPPEWLEPDAPVVRRPERRADLVAAAWGDP